MSETRLVTFMLGARSIDRLIGVHPDLEILVKAAIRISKIDFTVVEGVRSREKQLEYFRLGKSRTKNSRHLTGHAVDLMPYGDLDGDGDFDQIDKDQAWEKPHFLPINDAMQQAAANLGMKITWGGHWGWDFPHFEIDPVKYPFP